MSKVVRNYHSPYTNTSFKDYLASGSLTLCTCWKLTPKTGSAIGATSNTRDLILPDHPGIVFRTRQGLIPTATDSEAGLSSTGLEVDAVFDDALITEESVVAGNWDSAFFEIFIVNYNALNMGEYVMFGGFIGDVKTAGKRFRAEGRPLTAKSLQQTGVLQAPKCTVRALGDAQCKVNLLSPAAGDGGVITVTGTVTTGGSSIQFTDSSKAQASGYFKNGTLQFTSGFLNGKQAEIKDFNSGVFELHNPMTRNIDVGTTYTAVRGCDRTPETCINVYANIINIRAYSKVPGLEKAYRVKPEIRQ